MREARSPDPGHRRLDRRRRVKILVPIHHEVRRGDHDLLVNQTIAHADPILVDGPAAWLVKGHDRAGLTAHRSLSHDGCADALLQVVELAGWPGKRRRARFDIPADLPSLASIDGRSDLDDRAAVRTDDLLPIGSGERVRGQTEAARAVGQRLDHPYGL